jgi:hypothetical protein
VLICSVISLGRGLNCSVFRLSVVLLRVVAPFFALKVMFSDDVIRWKKINHRIGFSIKNNNNSNVKTEKASFVKLTEHGQQRWCSSKSIGIIIPWLRV